MSIEFEVAVEERHVLIRCQGSFASSELLEKWHEFFAAASGKGRKAILIDIRGLSGTPPTTTERYDHGVHVAELQRGIGRGLSLAVVGNEPIIDRDRFAEVVGSNRGAIARVFTEIEEAIEWIDEVAIHVVWGP